MTNPGIIGNAQPKVSTGHFDRQLVLNASIPVYNEMHDNPLDLPGVPQSPKSVWIKTYDQSAFKKAFPNATYSNDTAACNQTNAVSCHLMCICYAAIVLVTAFLLVF